MKRLIFLLLVGLSCCSKAEKAEPLFLIQSSRGSIEEVEEGFMLTMVNVNERVTFFSEGPVREAGFVDLGKFLKAWESDEAELKGASPSAGLIAVISDEVGKKEEMHALILSHPRYVASEKRLTFVVESVNMNKPLHAGRMNTVTLFMDGSGASGFKR